MDRITVMDRIQDGVYFRSTQRPPPCYRLLLLDVAGHPQGPEVHDALGLVMAMIGRLTAGEVPELAGTSSAEIQAIAESFRGMDVLLGLGRRLFDPAHHDPPLVAQTRPEMLAYLRLDGGPFPTLAWTEGVGPGNPGEADVALQFTGPTEAAVNRAAVEVWKLVVDRQLPLRPVASYGGFQRTDGRGWLEFHDGVSNIEASHRLPALEATGDPGWMTGGTYMAFLRLAIELRGWRTLSRADQELVVGRDKLSGAPLIGVRRGPDGEAIPIAAAALAGTSADRAHSDYADPPQTTDPLLEASHTHRANQNRASPFAPAGLRIFRQGYDFLDSIGPSGPRLGLNFVCFVGDLGHLHHLLHLPGWLGDVNFGGPANPTPSGPPSPQVCSVSAGGLYAVPPCAGPFPGAELFTAR